MKKTFFLILSFLLIISLFAPVSQAEDLLYSDISDWAQSEILSAQSAGLIPETFAEKGFNTSITRGEFAAVSVKLCEAFDINEITAASEAEFTDIADNIHKEDIKKAYALNIVEGVSEDSFAPDANISREDMATMLCRVVKRTVFENWTLATDEQFSLDAQVTEKFADDELISDYAKSSVYYLVKNGVLNGVGDNKFAPKNTTEAQEKEGYANTTVEQAVCVALRIYNAFYKPDFSVSRVFSDNMVIQRGEKIRVWGFAKDKLNGTKVTAQFKDATAETTIENGEWCLTFDETFEADINGSVMTVTAGENIVEFKDVLVGDVYMVIGQSNVEANVTGHLKYTDAATQGGGEEAISPDSIIRLNMTTTTESDDSIYPTRGSAEVSPDFLNKKQWTKTTLEDTLPFSAIGYYFADHMTKRMEYKVPVGVIEFGFSGFPLGSFLPNEIADEYNTDTYNEKAGYYTTRGRNSTGGSGRFIYNRHIYPFEKYAIAGVVWYQGESNCDFTEAPDYNKTFGALVEYMRKNHNLVNKDFPVLLVEFPSIYEQPEGYTGTGDLKWRYMDLGMIRSLMGTIPSEIDGTYTAASSDLWNNKEYYNGLHPYIKYEQSARLADLAEYAVLGKGDLNEICGPVFDSVQMSENKAVITFTNVGEGLTTIEKGTAVKGIVGLSTLHYDLQPIDCVSAQITAKDQITVVFDKAVRGIAYNFRSDDYYGDTLNLCNSYGNPAIGFCKIIEEKEHISHKSDSFVNLYDERAGLIGKDIELLKIDGEKLFPARKIDEQLKAVNNTVTVKKGAKIANVTGWAGFEYESLMWGYSIDGGDAIFNTYNTAARQSDLDNGGKWARRFLVDFDISDVPAGEHKITILGLLLDGEEEIPVEMISFNMIIEE